MDRNDAFVIALAGNPNVGKSSVFNALTGLNQHTGNWAGKTVSSARGRYRHQGEDFILVDLPGTYSLTAASAEEQAACDFICGGASNMTVVVIDSTCLERNLYLLLQIIETGTPVVVCLNLADEAARKKIRIDKDKLSSLLKVPVVETNARDGAGLANLKEIIWLTCQTTAAPTKNTEAKYLDGAQQRIKKAEEICFLCLSAQKPNANSFDRKLDRIFTGKFTAIPVMLLFLALIFWLTITGANYPSQLLSNFFSTAEAYLTQLFASWGVSSWWSGLLLQGGFRTTGWVISVMLPPMAIFFPLFTLLEDSGYLPRVAFNMDKSFSKAHACGKQCLTMCMGFGCNACGVTGCRIIDSPRERLIAMLTNCFVPCNGRFPTLIAIISMFFGGLCVGAAKGIISSLLLTLLIVIGIAVTLLTSRLLSATLLKGLPSSFTLELPPYRKPKIGSVIIRSVWDRTVFILARAVVVALPAGLIIWLLANCFIGGSNLFSYLTEFLQPLGSLMGLDGVILLAFILAFPANEILFPLIIMGYLSTGTMTAMDDLGQLHALLTANGWTALTACCTMLFSLLHFPCGTTCLTIFKESGSLKWTATAFLLPTLIGFSICCFLKLLF